MAEDNRSAVGAYNQSQNQQYLGGGTMGAARGVALSNPAPAQPTIIGALGACQNLIDRLEKRMQELDDRLSPVMQPPYPNAGDIEVAYPPLQGNVGETINNIARRLVTLGIYVETLTRRLEV